MPRCFLTEAHFCYVFQGLLINLHRMKRKVMLIADKARYKFLTTYYFLTNNYISCLWKKRNANTIFTCCFLIPIVKENLYDMWQCALSTLWLHDYYYKCKQKQKQGILHVKIRLLNIIESENNQMQIFLHWWFRKYNLHSTSPKNAKYKMKLTKWYHLSSFFLNYCSSILHYIH